MLTTAGAKLVFVTSTQQSSASASFAEMQDAEPSSNFEMESKASAQLMTLRVKVTSLYDDMT